MKPREVNLFLVGAMKAGTTSFAELLSGHSEIYGPPVKEPHFFVSELPQQLYDPGRFFNLDDYLVNQFPDTLHITKTETKDQYQKMYSQVGEEKYLLDASTGYLHAPESAELIYAYNPDAKIIILLRDPLKRAFSHYKMDLGKGRVAASFESLIAEDLANLKTGALPWFRYLNMSLYREPVARYRSLFSQVLVVRMEELLENETRVLETISRFLGIRPFVSGTIQHKNIARKPKFPKLLYLMNRLGVKDYFSKLFSSTFKRWVAGKISSEEKLEMDLRPQTLESLKEIFGKESPV